MSSERLDKELQRVLEALASAPLTSAGVAGRIHTAPAEADQSLLFPVLHGLEADGRLQAAWRPDANGVPHRTYRRRRLPTGRNGL
jgi:hypothetical protein